MTRERFAVMHRQAAALAARVRLPMHSRAWKGQTGEFAGSGSGASLDFQDHRAYQPGDDPRHINWQAYARTGHHTMKLFREEVRPIIELILDTSPSMFYDPSKAQLTAGLAFLVIHAAAATGAGIRVHTLCGGDAKTLSTDAARGHDWLTEATQSRTADPPDPARIELRANTVRIFLSDLLYPGNPMDFLTPLGGRGSMLILLCPFLASEAAPNWEGNCELVDVERATHHPGKIDGPLVRRFREAYTRHFDLWGQAARRHHAPMARIPAEVDFPNAILRHAVNAGAFVLA